MNRKQRSAALAVAVGASVMALAGPARAGTVELKLPDGATGGATGGINDAGVIVGSARGGATLSPVRWNAAGEPQRLAVPEGLPEATATGVGADGTVVGTGDSGTYTLSDQALRWAADGTLTRLPGLPGSVIAQVNGVNDGGVAVGQSGSETALTTTRWEADGTATALDGNSAAMGINDGGVAVGVYKDESNFSTLKAASWSAGGKRTLLAMPFGDSASLAYGINDAGVTVGFTGVSDFGFPRTMHAARWDADGSVTRLPCLPRAAGPAPRRTVDAVALLRKGSPALESVLPAGGGPGAPRVAVAADDCMSWAQAVNEDGVIIGQQTTTSDGVTQRVRWNADGTVTALDGLDAAVALNRAGVVAGASGGRPASWTR